MGSIKRSVTENWKEIAENLNPSKWTFEGPTFLEIKFETKKSHPLHSRHIFNNPQPFQNFTESLVLAQSLQQKVSELKKTPQIYGWKLDNTLCNLIWKPSQPCADEYSTLARTKKFK